MYTILSTVTFQTWFDTLRDKKGRARIADRIYSASQGNFGDHKVTSVGGVWEMRVNAGRAIGCTTRAREQRSICCSSVEISQRRRKTLSEPPRSPKR